MRDNWWAKPENAAKAQALVAGILKDIEGELREEQEQAARLASVAPDLVRALLAVEVVEHDEGGWFCPLCHHGTEELDRPATAYHAPNCALDAALRKAGARE